jgi:hypothetical protein
MDRYDANEHLHTILLEILSRLEAHNDSWPYREAVDTTVVTDYLTHITTPIDLTIIRSRLESRRHYISVRLFAADVLLMCDNCRTYNENHYDYFRTADELERFAAGLLETISVEERRLDGSLIIGTHAVAPAVAAVPTPARDAPDPAADGEAGDDETRTQGPSSRSVVSKVKHAEIVVDDDDEDDDDDDDDDDDGDGGDGGDGADGADGNGTGDAADADAAAAGGDGGGDGTGDAAGAASEQAMLEQLEEDAADAAQLAADGHDKDHVEGDDDDDDEDEDEDEEEEEDEDEDEDEEEDDEEEEDEGEEDEEEEENDDGDANAGGNDDDDDDDDNGGDHDDDDDDDDDGMDEGA